MAENGGPLSDRELDVMRFVVLGKTNQEIARELDISPNTVKVHLRKIFEKLGVASRTEATLVVIREGWVGVPGGIADEPGVEFNGAGHEPEIETATSEIGATELPIAAYRAETAEAPSGEAVVLPDRTTRHSPFVWSSALLALVVVALLALIGWQFMRRSPVADVAPGLATPQRWSQLPELPEARVGAAAAAFSGHLYLIGGQAGEAPVARVAIYDPSTDEWEAGAAKPSPVSDAEIAVVGGRLVVPGGTLANGEPTEVVEVYDPASDRWTSLAPLPRPLARYGLATYEGRLYLFGGWDGEGARAEVLSYEPDADEWQEVTSLDPPRADAAAALLNDVIYVVGGAGADGAPLAEVALLRPGRKPLLQRGAALPAAEAEPAVATLAGNLYLFGQDQALRFDPADARWEPLEAMPVTDWHGKAVASFDPYVIGLGGRVNGEPSAAGWRYQAVYRVFIPQAPAGDGK